MLYRYQNKQVRITTEDGNVFTGIAEVLPSGWGLHEFDREEESIQLDDVILFKSDIRTIEELPETSTEAADPRRFDEMMGALLEGPYWIVDILPEQVPANAAGQYFAVERYFLQPERIVPLRRKYAELLLRLNCYVDIAVSFDSCASWETNPDPETFAERLAGLSGNEFLRAVFAEQNAMIDYDHNDTYLTVYDPGEGYPEVDKLLLLSKKLNVSLDSLLGIENTTAVSGEGKASAAIRIISPHEGVITNASKVTRSQQFKGVKNSPKFALYASDGNDLSLWGAQNTFLAWYRNLEDVTKEIAEIQAALDAGAASYTLQYSVKCKQNLFRTIED